MPQHTENLTNHLPFNSAFKALDGSPVVITDEERERITIKDPLEVIKFAVDFLPATNTWFFLADWLNDYHEPYLDEYHAWQELKKAKAAQE